MSADQAHEAELSFARDLPLTQAAIAFASDHHRTRELRMQIAPGLEDTVASVKVRRYRQSLDMLDDALPDRHLVELLRFELESLEKLPPDAQR